MCFTEYVAYLCGHTSTAVNRPCPMTTHLHSNPCCLKPACRPFLAHTMCHPCHRIMHGRKIDIIEYEHLWMHERGACKCDVQFPALQQPRLVHRPSAVEDESGTAAATETDAGASDAGAVPPQSAATTMHTSARHLRQSDTPGQEEGTEIPLYQEVQVGKSVEVFVRLPSLYGAEWTKDHAKLHQTGQCKCPVSFERYQPLSTEDHNGKTKDIRKKDNFCLHAILDKSNDDSPELEHSDSSGQACKDSHEPTSPKEAHDPQSPTAATSSHEDDSATARPNVIPVDNAYNSFGYYQIPAGHVARWTMDPPPGSLLDEILGPVGPDAAKQKCHRPVDVQTMHYQQDEIPISGNPIVDGPFKADELPSIVEYQQPNTTIAGFPIGAGPEGDSHAGDFGECSLYMSSEDSPVKKRRLSSEF
ncbi:hypothetical protein HD806DRAFT_545284 [Xylariaceae sp. AK1471]|nr:hypothetical protein HD806DRAFT_545284 [Xylariaceae sp. AK1471]